MGLRSARSSSRDFRPSDKHGRGRAKSSPGRPLPAGHSARPEPRGGRPAPGPPKLDRRASLGTRASRGSPAVLGVPRSGRSLYGSVRYRRPRARVGWSGGRPGAARGPPGTGSNFRRIRPGTPERLRGPGERSPPQTAACARSPPRTPSAAALGARGPHEAPGGREGAGRRPRAGGSRGRRGPGGVSPAAAAARVEQAGRRGGPAHAKRLRCRPAPPPLQPAPPPHSRAPRSASPFRARHAVAILFTSRPRPEPPRRRTLLRAHPSRC